uniref:MADF domain-containing protein n=1 Tax=Steinernema glaseri TaxID=37863 RepID=A0A1I7YV31_9BILA
MEDGDWEAAAHTKELLEELQRERRRQRNENTKGCLTTKTKITWRCLGDADYEPVWFRKKTETQVAYDLYEFTGEYWNSKAQRLWDRCTDIFHTD